MMNLRSTLSLVLAALCAGPVLHAAALPNRLSPNAASSLPQALPQGVSPRVQHSAPLGHLEGDMQLGSMSVILSPSADQSAALDQLLADQQNPSSPRYHQWLTPEQFGAEFGASDSDLAILRNWLTSQGMQITGIAPSRNQITFSGSAANVEGAFHTTLGRFSRKGQNFFENSTAPEVPSALTGIVGGITGLSSYRMQPHTLHVPPTASFERAGGARPDYTDGRGNHYLSPYDWRQIYNLNTLYNSGYTGAGITIAVLGQSAVDPNQIAYYQQLTGQTVKAPSLVLVPGTGTSTAYVGDESESEADLELSSGIAPGATVLFVYSGSSTTADVSNAAYYAITNKVAPIITLSYGYCEAEETSTFFSAFELLNRQANAQGQTFLAASGDSGAAGCDASNNTTSYDGLQVGYPASSPYVTGIGGTQFADTTGNYWAATNNSQKGSALGYIPETTWNESSPTSGLGASTGGVSRVFSKPNWQTGTNVPADGARDVPDVSFTAAGHDGYLFCTSDTSYAFTSGGTTYTASCTASAFGGASIVSGTSLPTPAFAGALAIIESANGSKALGNINPMLYSLAASTPAVFHDVTAGNNMVPCVSGTIGCVNGTLGYNAGAGYDLATGLGSMDLGAFSAAIPAASVANARAVTISITPTSATATSITVGITVSSSTSTTTPTGTLSVAIDGGTPQTVTLANGAATATFTSTGFTAGSHTVTAAYSGDSNYGGGTGSAKVAVSLANGTLTLAVTPSTLTINSSTAHSGVWTLTTTSNANYSGIVIFNVTGGPSVGCFLINQADASIAASSSVAVPVTYSFSSSDCSSTGTRKVLAYLGPEHATPALSSSANRGSLPMLALAFTGLAGGTLLRRRRTWMTGLLSLAFLAGAAGLSGCGSGSAPLTGVSAPTGSVPKGTYTVTFSVTSLDKTLTSSASTQLVIQ